MKMGEVHRRKENSFSSFPSSNPIPWSSRQARKKSSRLIEKISLLFSIAIFQSNCFLKRIFV